MEQHKRIIIIRKCRVTGPTVMQSLVLSLDIILLLFSLDKVFMAMTLAVETS